MLPATPSPEGGRFLQFSCNGAQHCHTELQYFLHPSRCWRLKTELGANPHPKDHTDPATVRRDPRTEADVDEFLCSTSPPPAAA